MDGFHLELIPLDELKKIILDNNNDNPRNAFFQREMLEVIKLYESNSDVFCQNKSLIKGKRENF